MASLGGGSISSSLLSSLELRDTKVYEPWIRALLGTAPHFCGGGWYHDDKVDESFLDLDAGLGGPIAIWRDHEPPLLLFVPLMMVPGCGVTGVPHS